MKGFLHAIWITGALLLAGCGTTYTVPTVSTDVQSQANAMFAEERAKPLASPTSDRAAVSRFDRVVRRVKPVAMAFCETQVASGETCDLPIIIDHEMKVVNAYQTKNASGPFIAFSVPLLKTVRNDDELAFVLGHEYAHHIAGHLRKGEQQALAGALVMGTITAAAQAYASSNNPYAYTDTYQQELDRNMELGAALGQKAYGQTYELESDVVATYIARSAGYDPVKGARFFAIPAEAKTTAGVLSVWGTHPPNETRLGTVIEADRAARQGIALSKKQ